MTFLICVVLAPFCTFLGLWFLHLVFSESRERRRYARIREEYRNSFAEEGAHHG